jgi:meiotically up-regulated gene 157 (Mug157) protein
MYTILAFNADRYQATDTLMMYGRGPPVKLTGLSRSLFRPSDDAVTMGYNIPGNAMACTELTHVADMLTKSASGIDGAAEVGARVATVAKSLCAAMDSVIRESSKREDRVLPYEMDGYGSRYDMDDANIPSLLSLPFLGYMDNTHPIYQDTRAYVLSSRNPYYYAGAQGEGIGGPHVGYNYAWPMAIVVRAMTSNDDDEVYFP